MAALTKERETPQLMNGGKQLALPVKGDTTIFQGALVAIDANGFAVPAKKTTGLTAVGRAEETMENNGADGEETIRVQRGVFIYKNTATQANKLSAAHVLKPCYMEDDQTVTAAATGSSIAGVVLRVDADGVTVEVGTAAPVAGAPA